MSRRQARQRALRYLAFVVASACFAAGCAGRISQNATAGALAGLQEQADAQPQKPAHEIAGNAVVGAVEALDDPAQRARIERVVADAVSAAATAAVEKATRELVAQLGPDGQGPLAVSFARTGEEVSAAAVTRLGGELSALAPGCSGPDPLACLEKRLQQTARTTAASFSAGVRDAIGWQLLLVAFGVGAGAGVLGAWLWSLRSERQRQGRRRALRVASAQ